MLRDLRSLFLIACLILAAGMQWGCAGHRVNLLETGDVTIELETCKGICAINIDAYQDGDDLIVTGKVRRDHSATATGIGYVKITVKGPDGSILEEVDSNYSPRIVRRKGLRESSFTARIPLVPPKGTVIHVAYQGI